MPRRKRLVIPGLPHHVTQRGARRQTVFFADEDRERYLELLETISRKYELEILSLCLMRNHVHHLIVPHDEKGLSRALQIVHKKYAYAINRQHDWSGHLWQERFYSSPVDRDAALIVLKYIERNPVEAHIVAHPFDYQWSSARAIAGLEQRSLLARPPWWQKILSSIDNWQQWLATPNGETDVQCLRQCTAQDRPFGGADFISRLESELNMPLVVRQRGRPRSEE